MRTDYRCGHGRGPCDLPRFREEEIAERLGQVLKDVSLPSEVALSIEASLHQAQVQARKHVTQERTRIERELAGLHSRMDSAYKDKLEGTISLDFWQRMQRDFESEELRHKSLLEGSSEADTGQKMLDMQRVLELAQKAYFLYLTQKPAEKVELLRKVLLNCKIDAVSLYPTYRKPFDLICKRVKTEQWSARTNAAGTSDRWSARVADEIQRRAPEGGLFNCGSPDSSGSR
jgi:hypothetical protein